MSYDFTSDIQAAQDIIKEFGRAIQLVTPSGPANPDKPWQGGGKTTTDVVGCFLPASGSGFGKELATDEMLARVSQVVLVAGDANDYSNTSDVVDGQTYGVEWVSVLKPSSQIVLYAIGLKR